MRVCNFVGSSFALSLLSLFSLAEFKKIVYATSVGFLIMGFVGFFVKIIHIPINNILVRFPPVSRILD